MFVRFSFWCNAKKICFFDRTKIDLKSALGRPRLDLIAPGVTRVYSLWPGGPRAASRARTYQEKMTEEQLVEDLARHGPMARRVFFEWQSYNFHISG